MKHVVVRWNPATREHFCVRCGRTSDATSIADAQERLEQYDCIVPSVDVTTPEAGAETVRLNRKKYKWRLAVLPDISDGIRIGVPVDKLKNRC